MTLNTLIDNFNQHMFKLIQYPDHCLHFLPNVLGN